MTNDADADDDDVFTQPSTATHSQLPPNYHRALPELLPRKKVASFESRQPGKQASKQLTNTSTTTTTTTTTTTCSHSRPAQHDGHSLPTTNQLPLRVTGALTPKIGRYPQKQASSRQVADQHDDDDEVDDVNAEDDDDVFTQPSTTTHSQLRPNTR